MARIIRVLVTDDSPFYRRLFTEILASQTDMEVVGTASDPLEAREKIKALNPDVLTLDVEMPHMDGLQFLEKIMTLRPMPVVMVSTLTSKGAEATLQALASGAVDCLAKPEGALSREGMATFAEQLCGMVRAAAQSRVRTQRAASTKSAPLPPLPGRGMSPVSLIAIGASTGGVEAIHAILPRLPANLPPIVIVQHMPPGFTASFARRLNGICRMEVREAQDGLALHPGLACIAPGGRHLLVAHGVGGGLKCTLEDGAAVSGHRPSVDKLFESVAVVTGRSSLGLILTGMGSDGADGLLRLRQAGAMTLGQNEASCVVYGMPRVAFQRGAVTSEVALVEMAEAVCRACHPVARAVEEN
jgi:two-component system chemotaxis response regulator CheB